MAFRGLTKKGTDYLATRLANQLPVEFLKVEIGNGAMAEGHNPKNQESLVSYKKQAKILKKIQENNAVNITIQITNEDITQGFYLKEIGIYVRENDTEKLYWYCNEDNAQYIPAKSDSVIAFEIDIRMEVTNSDTTIINWSGQETWVNKEYLEENYTQNGGYKGTSQEINDRLNSALGKHDGDFPVANAVVGNVYYSEVTKKYYKCKIGGPAPVPNGNFIDLSILENLNRLENLFSFNLIKSSQNKGYKFYTKNSYIGNYIDVSDTFSTVDFFLISPARSELTDAEARFINYQGFVNGKILINAYWLNGNSLEKKYSASPSNTLLTASCVAFVYGTLK